MSSALRTYSERSALLIACLYDSIALRMLSTSLFQVKGALLPSSKNDRGIEAAETWPNGLLVKEVVVVPMWSLDMPFEASCTAFIEFIDRAGFSKPRLFMIGDVSNDSVDAAGDTPSEM